MSLGAQIIVGILILVGGGLALPVSKWVLSYMTDAVATAIVKSINGQLGLAQIRQDLKYVKSEVSINGGESLKDRVLSIERQLENIITSGR